jgi:hypothetical protein
MTMAKDFAVRREGELDAPPQDRVLATEAVA